MNRSRLTLCIAVAIVTSAAVEGGPQAAENTGAGPGLRVGSAAPTIVVDREAIWRSGATSIAQLLQRLPISGTAANSRVNLEGDGSAGIALRNLGSGRTLVLVDGRRSVGTGLVGHVDLNSIPIAAVDSIYVLTDGATARYGGGAIAGVVDIRLKRDYGGAEISGQWGEFTAGDGRRQSYDFMIGFGGERGSVTLGAGLVKEAPVWAGDRAISAVSTFGLPGNNVLANASAIGPWPLVFLASLGEGRILIPGRPGNAPEDYRPYDLLIDGYNFAPESYLQAEQERASLFMNGRHQIVDGIEFYTQASFNERQSGQRRAAFPLAGGIANSAIPVTVPADHVYNPFGVEIAGFGRRLSELGGLHYTQDVDTWVFTGGLRGDARLGERSLHWDIGYRHGRSTRVDRNSDLVLAPNVERALGPSFIDADGVPRCGIPGAVVVGCVPLNIFGPLGSITPAMSDYVTYVEQDVRRNELNSYWAEAGLDVFELVADQPATVLAGYQGRREQAADQPDSLATLRPGQTDGTGGQRLGAQGSFRLDELFVQLQAPLLANIPGVRSLDLSATVRHSEHSGFGTINSWSGALAWQPFDAWTVRASYDLGFGEPDIDQLFRDPTLSFISVQDPCGLPRFDQLSPAAQQRCLEAGIEPGFQQSDAQLRLTRAGNPVAESEISRRLNLGIVYRPGFIDGLGVTLNWYRIDIADALGLRSGQAIVDACYLSDSAAERARSCPFITREPSISEIVTVPVNFQDVEVEVWDLGLRYGSDTPWGRFVVDWTTAYSSRWRFSEQGHAGRMQDRLGQDLGDDAYPRLRSNLDLLWRQGGVALGWRVRYQHHVDEACRFGAFGELRGFASPCSHVDHRSSTFQAGFHRQGSTAVHDLHLAWTAPWAGELGLGVDNIFDRGPPPSWLAGEHSFNTRQHETPGRFWYLQYRQSW